MKASDVQKIISEVVQGLLGLGALAGIILFQLNHQPVPELLWLILGAILLAFGIKIGLPLQSGEGEASPNPSASNQEAK